MMVKGGHGQTNLSHAPQLINVVYITATCMYLQCTCMHALCVCTVHVGSSKVAGDGGISQTRHHGQTHQTTLKAGAPRYIYMYSQRAIMGVSFKWYYLYSQKFSLEIGTSGYAVLFAVYSIYSLRYAY